MFIIFSTSYFTNLIQKLIDKRNTKLCTVMLSGSSCLELKFFISFQNNGIFKHSKGQNVVKNVFYKQN